MFLSCGFSESWPRAGRDLCFGSLAVRVFGLGRWLEGSTPRTLVPVFFHAVILGISAMCSRRKALDNTFLLDPWPGMVEAVKLQFLFSHGFELI